MLGICASCASRTAVVARVLIEIVVGNARRATSKGTALVASGWTSLAGLRADKGVCGTRVNARGIV